MDKAVYPVRFMDYFVCGRKDSSSMPACIVKITKKSVEACNPGQWIWDNELKGFGVSVSPKGRRTYYTKLTVFDGNGLRQVKRKIGVHGQVTCDQARALARQRIAVAALRLPPAPKPKEALIDITVAEAFARYMDEHVRPRLKPRSIGEAERFERLVLIPFLGPLKLSSVNQANIGKIHHDLRKTPVKANRSLSALSGFFNYCEAVGLRADGTNPCRRIKKFPERARERFLTREEFQRLAAALTDLKPDNPFLAAFFFAAIFTGLRKTELLDLHWEDVDLEAARLRLKDSKTGPRTVPINEPARQLLADLPRVSHNPFVFVGRHDRGRLVGVQKAWQRLRAKVGIADLRIHDLRHSFASFAASAGISLQMIGRLLGHKSVQTTQRYAHLFENEVAASTNKVAAAMMGNEPSGAAGRVHEEQKEDIIEQAI